MNEYKQIISFQNFQTIPSTKFTFLLAASWFLSYSVNVCLYIVSMDGLQVVADWYHFIRADTIISNQGDQ